MKELTIYKRYFYNSDCYKSNITQKTIGVQVHSTGANNPYIKRYVQPDDGRLGKNIYSNHSNQSGTDVCASAYLGKLADDTLAVYQTLPWDRRCWLSGKGNNGNANKLGLIGYEICEDNLTDEDYFKGIVLEKAVLLTAHICILRNIDPLVPIRYYNNRPLYPVSSHKELHDLGLASNHGDIDHWLKKYSMTMGDFRSLVKSAISEGVHVTYIDCDSSDVSISEGSIDFTTIKGGDIMYNAEVISPGSYLNMRSEKSTTSTVIAKLSKGTVIGVLDDTDPNWFQVSYSDKVGYVMTQSSGGTPYIKVASTSEESTSTIESTDKTRLKTEILDTLSKLSSLISQI